MAHAFEAIDLGYLGLRGAACAFAIAHRCRDERTLVECGPAACVGALFDHPSLRGVRVRSLFVTHVHLDHAGAAGHLAQRGVPVHVHPLGAPHLVDPARLVASSRRVHGDAFDRHYGEPLPCPERLVRAVADGESVDIGDGLVVQAIETPGHAAHHHAWLLRGPAQATVAFTGDVAAMVVPNSSFISVPMPPNQFDPSAWRSSLDRLAAERPAALVLTHGGVVAGDERSSLAFLGAVRRRLDEECEWVQGLVESLERGAFDEGEAIRRYQAWLEPRARQCGVGDASRAAFLGAAFCRMNIAGVRRWCSVRS